MRGNFRKSFMRLYRNENAIYLKFTVKLRKYLFVFGYKLRDYIS